MPTRPLVIGEVFPPDDIVGQWIFSMAMLNDDLTFITGYLKRALDERDLRAMLYLQRQQITRLYEAFRILRAIDQHPEIAAFVGDKPSDWLTFLRQAYLQQPQGDQSLVKRLYQEARHQTVHYSHVGSDELRQALHACRAIPARMVVKDARLTATWTQAVSGMRLFGDVREPDFYEKYKARSELLGKLAMCWLMFGNVMFMVYAKNRGIDMRRVVEMHADLPDSPPSDGA